MLGTVAKSPVERTRHRRTPRLALGAPIRVFGIDYQGKDFVEDSLAIVVNLHGAKIRLGRKLIPDQEIRILSQKTRQESVFRVVNRVGGPDGQYSFWGVETTNPANNIWGVTFPQLNEKDQTGIRIMLQCPECHVRELLYLNEPLLQSLGEAGGLVRGCATCGKSGLWQRVSYYDS